MRGTRRSPTRRHIGTINDDDAFPTVSVSDAVAIEGDSGTVTATFTLTLNAPSGRGLSVDYATADGTASSPADYVPASGTVNFAAGETSKTVSVLVNGDQLDEIDETFTLSLSNGVNVTIGDGSGLGTISDDDPLPALTIDDVTVAEGDSGTIAANFTVTLSAASGRPVTVNYASADGTATAPGDYAPASGSLTFAAGQTTKTVTVNVNGDVTDEMDEIFTVTLSTAVNATLLDGQGLGTITDDDGFPSLSINDVTVTEANGGTVNAVFNVNLSNASGQTVSVAFATADGSAVAGADYTSASGTLEFTPGQLTQTITVPVTGDLLDEIDESFTVTLTNPTNASITDGIGLGTIADNDATPTLVVNDVTVAEGDTGTTAATFTVTLSAPSGRAAAVDYATLNGSATAPADYAGATGSLSFAAGETTKQVTVLVNGDTLDEANETYTLNLSNPTNATILDASGTGTINDDDPLPSLSIDDVTLTEGDSGSSTATFTVTLSTISGRTVSVDYAAANGTATAPGDYIGTGGTVIFAAGETTRTVTVQVNGDTLDEANESYFVNLSNPSNATVTDGQGLGTITDDDAMPSLVIDDVSVTEGDAGTTNANFTVSLSSLSGQPVNVDFATANGTAIAPGDYTARTGVLTFTAGQLTRTITVAVNPDTIDEVNETYFLNLSNATNATIADNQGVGTIIDDDGLPSLSVNDVTVIEGQSGTVNANFTVSLSAPSGQSVSVGWTTADGTATSPADYVGGGGSVVFDPGITSRTLTVVVNSDTMDEIDETFTVHLTDPNNATIADGIGLGTITDDDAPPGLSVNDVTVTEGDAGTVNAVFTVSLSSVSGRAVSVDWATANGTAGSPADYQTAGGQLSFAAGETTKQVAVTVNADLLDEVNETFFVNLSNPTNATVADGQGIGTITDNDPLPTLAVDDVTVTELDSGNASATFTVSLSAPSGRDVNVNFATANGSASSPSDYESAIGALTFLPGESTKTSRSSSTATCSTRPTRPSSSTLPARRTRRSSTARGSGRSPTTIRRPRCP